MQEFQKPFDSPAVVVVGHQTSGKSALIEALMGFQFNQVGGGTKTRRPVALRMQYNPSCASPRCFLTLENGKEEQRSLADIQAYIEEENKRLEKDSSRCFDQREINVRMEYKYCPNMIVIDTPGMIHPPKAKQLTPQQRGLAMAAREAEDLVMNKISCQDYIILCVEDTTDWKHATARNIVMRADPELQRTVLVTTKLDTKIPQFSDADDLDDFYRAGPVKRMFPHILGGPFFTSVPSGRVGSGKDFNKNEDFVMALREVEKSDHAKSISKLGNTIQSRESLGNVGITRLRTFLEARVEDCYRRNVAKIVPILQQEMSHAKRKLEQTEKELNALSIDRLKHAAGMYREKFSTELGNVIHGSIKVNPTVFGENLDEEQLRGGSFLEKEQVQSDVWQRLLAQEVGNSGAKLYGGAQYHRALREFNVAIRHMSAALVTEDEIANAAGVGDVHDGVNFMRAACVIAVEKAQQSFEPMLEALRHRLVHIMRRSYAVVEAILDKPEAIAGSRKSSGFGGASQGEGLASAAMTAYNKPYRELIRRCYDNFVTTQVEACLQKCRDDLHGMTRFVTWDSTGGSSVGNGASGASAVYNSLPTPGKMVEIYSVAVEERKSGAKSKSNRMKKRSKKDGSEEDKPVAEKVVGEWETAVSSNSDTASGGLNSQQQQMIIAKASEDAESAELGDYHNLMQLTEEMLSGRDAGRTNSVVSALVQYVIRSWRDHFARTVAMKFNCFYLMPFLDDFPAYLRSELEKMHENGEVDELFDIYEARRGLQQKRDDLLSEIKANHKLQERFNEINLQLGGSATPLDSYTSSDEEEYDDAYVASYGMSAERVSSTLDDVVNMNGGSVQDSDDYFGGEQSPLGSGAWMSNMDDE
jgi:hypothetical protein